MGNWQTKEQLKDLTISLCEYASVSGSEEEIGIMEFVDYQLKRLEYFKEHESHLQTHYTDDGRKFVSALVKSRKKTKKTLIIMGHLDVVDVEDYGEWKHLAFRPRELTEQMLAQKDNLPADVQNDLEKGEEWLFGRGVMDMKAGIALCMSMIEKAAEGAFEGNLLMLAVPDEEVNSTGMRAAVGKLLEISDEHDLKYEMAWNTEPVFSGFPGDESLYVYRGSLGKVLPGFYCYGEEAHVAEPFSGINGNFMTSYLSDAFELNPELTEQTGSQKTPPPTSLLQKDLKSDYSTQIPHTAVVLFNLLFMKKKMKDVTEELLEVAEKASKRIIQAYDERERVFAKSHDYEPEKKQIRILTYEELWQHAVNQVGEEEVKRQISFIQANESQLDDRDVTIHTVHHIAGFCKDLAPMVVLFYAPPFYPAVESVEHSLVDRVARKVKQEAEQVQDISVTDLPYFPGLSDLSYLQLPDRRDSLGSMLKNMPLWEVTYDLPLEAMEKLNLPVMNFGPLGRGAHSWTERLQVTYSFDHLPKVMEKGIKEVFAQMD
ncbi:M20/M25/M40 family metallo-hydrolase [Alteribacter keqinensis]|uniref:M20/M25/M40 family metallo-hydrolase n=1 Tax=Alteribacter keqinensis TaxID=2483800 RepID=A0A3M7TTQ4_9BACI|nr:M20/M25/M40 family metallo-hydrolase [Alteribacter keqinensis]RNA69026.1 M20/M25/M40 family metallo-hydrolase [Alteribacter keqinensis]